MKTLSVTLASLFYIGFIPYAPGTFGTIFAVIFIILLKPEKDFLLILLVFGFLLGLYVSERAEKLLNQCDSPHIVIDEFMGYLVSIYAIPAELRNLFISFLIFRFFDITKPFPISKVEKGLRGGLAIMMDDIIAGFYTNISVRILLICGVL